MPMKNQIESKRKELLHIVKEHGLSSKYTLKCSEELDKLIIAYQKNPQCH